MVLTKLLIWGSNYVSLYPIYENNIYFSCLAVVYYNFLELDVLPLFDYLN